ncbi:hypothetical protein D3C87_1762640 [compost metagenome]
MVAGLQELSEGLIFPQGQLRRQAVVPLVARQSRLPVGRSSVLTEVKQRVGGERNPRRRIEECRLHRLCGIVILAACAGLPRRTAGKIAQSVA